MMLHLHVFRRFRSSPIFRFRKTIAWSYHLEFLNLKKRINDFYLMISFKFTKSVRNSDFNSKRILSSMRMNILNQQTVCLI
jgi:hypothetical protein